MKKLFCIFAVLILTTLCGCKPSDGNDRKFMVSAIGFSTDGAMISVSAETVIVNSESAELSPSPTVISGSGATISEAFDSIAASLSRPVLLEHCGIIAIGSEMTPAWLDKICDYCFSENRITLSAYMVSAENPTELLSGEPKSSVAVGYDMMGIIEQQTERTGIAYNSRYFEVEALREKGEKIFTLPHFTRDKDGIAIDGISVFKDDKLKAVLDSHDAGLYALLTGNFREGKLRFGTSEYKVNSRKVEYGYSDGKENAITLKLYLSGSGFKKENTDRLENELSGLEKRLRGLYGEDIFGFTDILSRRYPKFADKHGENYGEFYKNALFSAECIVAGGMNNDG